MSIPTSFLVCVKRMTFNHHAYIEDAMNGFVMQETDFPFVCVIIDDASTDGEPEVIKKYFQENFSQLDTDETDDYVRTLGRHKTNENCYFLVIYLKYNHYSIKKSKMPYYAEYQGNAVVNYTSHDVPYTRVIEHKHFESFGAAVYDNPQTVVSEEYSTEYRDGMEPYYPVNDDNDDNACRHSTRGYSDVSASCCWTFGF